MAPGNGALNSERDAENSSPLAADCARVADQAERRRWLVLAIFCVSSGLSGILWITFAPVASLCSSFYDVSLGSINSLSLVYMILFLPGIFLTSYLMTQWGLRRVIVVGSCLNLLSAVLRASSVLLPQKAGPLFPAFSVLLVGQCFGALAQPLFITVPVRLANDWFGATERDAATVIAAMVNPVGNAIGQVVPPMFVSQQPANTGAVHGLGWLLAGEAVLTLFAFAWTCSCFAADPKAAPSRAALVRRSSRQELLQSLSQRQTSSPGPGRAVSTDSISAASAILALKIDYAALLKDLNFVILLLAFGMGLGILNAFLTTIEQLVRPAQYDSDSAGLFGGVVLLSGLPVAGLAGVVLDRTHAYRSLLKVGCTSMLLAVLGFLMLLRPGQIGLVCVGSALLGAATTPLLPVAMETAVECTFPIPEEASGGLLMFSGQVFGVAFTLTMQNLLTSDGSNDSFSGVWTPAAYFMLCVMGAVNILSLCYRGQYKRHVSECSSER